jgi:hypothetical protein
MGQPAKNPPNTKPSPPAGSDHVPRPEPSDALPEWAITLLMALWLLLFGGRWVVVNLLILAGLLTMPQLTELDRFLTLAYLALFVLTVVTLALRGMRRLSQGTHRK